MSKWNEPIDPALIGQWQRGAVKLGIVLSIVGALTLIFSERAGLLLMGIGALLIFWVRPKRT